MARFRPAKHPKNTGRIFRDLEDDAHVIRRQFRFLRDVWDFWEDIGDPVYTFLGFKEVATGKWIEHAIGHGFSFPEISELLTQHSRWDYDQYFCPNPFSEPRRKRQYALPTRFGWCDMDASDPDAYEPMPSLVWETSPERYQALWSWDKTCRPSEAETFSKALAYRHGGDRNGWSATKMLRLIGSVNHKPQYDEPFVQTVAFDWTEIISRPLPLKGAQHSWPIELPSINVDPTRHDRAVVLERYRMYLQMKVRYLIGDRTVREKDRSAQVFHMIAGLHKAGASPDEIACVLWDSPYFVDKHGRDLGKLNDEIARVIGKLGAGR